MVSHPWPPGSRWRPDELRRRVVSTEPVEVAAEEYERIIERVAAIDVAKASGKVCVRVPHASVPGRRGDEGMACGGDD